MLDARELCCLQVGENEWVIRRTFLDGQGRKHHQYIAQIANTTTDNRAIAEEFVKGIAALNGLTRAAPDVCHVCNGEGVVLENGRLRTCTWCQ